MHPAGLARAAIIVAAFSTATGLVGCAAQPDGAPLSRPVPTVDAEGEALAAMTYLVECVPDELVQRPERYTLSCADGNDMLEGLMWVGWGEPTASAVGALMTNNCEPICAEGQLERRPVTVSATDLSVSQGAAIYRTLTVDHGADRPEGVPRNERFELPGIDTGDSDRTADDVETPR